MHASQFERMIQRFHMLPFERIKTTMSLKVVITIILGFLWVISLWEEISGRTQENIKIACSIL